METDKWLEALDRERISLQRQRAINLAFLILSIGIITSSAVATNQVEYQSMVMDESTIINGGIFVVGVGGAVFTLLKMAAINRQLRVNSCERRKEHEHNK